jgi:hypothetical protein
MIGFYEPAFPKGYIDKTILCHSHLSDSVFEDDKLSFLIQDPTTKGRRKRDWHCCETDHRSVLDARKYDRRSIGTNP